MAVYVGDFLFEGHTHKRVLFSEWDDADQLEHHRRQLGISSLWRRNMGGWNIYRLTSRQEAMARMNGASKPVWINGRPEGAPF